MPTMTEQDLVTQFKEQKNRVDEIEASLEIAKKELEFTKKQLLDLMTEEGKERTATYEGIGFVSLMKPKVRASCSEENKPLLFGYLRDIGRDDLIKEVVNPQSLSSFVKEQLEVGQQPPEFISFFLQPDVKLYSR